MNTLADVKRRMKVGLVFQCEHFTRPKASGRREVVKVQTNAIEYMFTHPDTGELVPGWAYWPKAKNVEVIEERCAFLSDDGQRLYTYHFDPEGA